MKFLGIDQYGQTYKIKAHPRKELQKFLCGKIHKMYVDNGTHVGYVIGPLWIHIFKLQPWKNQQ